MATKGDQRLIYWFKELGIKDVPIVGGKNASLGEMFANLTSKGVNVPDGFAISAYAYNHYLDSSGIRGEIEGILRGLNTSDLQNLASTGERIRTLIRGTPLPGDLEQAIKDSYDELCKEYGTEVDTAVRSSATAEDLPDASFAGQQDTYLNVRGHDHLIEACRACFASLFTDRAIVYREEKDFDHFSVALSIGVQRMVRSDLASAGVMFSIDTESGFKDAVYITGGYGLGENVVQGSINPDEFYVHKPTLKSGFKPIIHSHVGEKQQKMIYVDAAEGRGTENVPVPPEERERFCLDREEVLTLARWAAVIEDHYSEEAGYFKPMDIEWAKDGQTGDLFIVQARPETVVSRREAGVLRRMVLQKTGPVLAEGMAVGDTIGTGPANVISGAEGIAKFKEGDVLVTEMTDPDWVPIMKIASAIVTDSGGRTCHAAIISRELGIPCIVGTGDGSKKISAGDDITVSCAGGSKGTVCKGILPFEEETIRLDQLEMPKVKMMFQQSDPDRAFPDARYPNAGVGLLRIDELFRNEDLFCGLETARRQRKPGRTDRSRQQGIRGQGAVRRGQTGRRDRSHRGFGLSPAGAGHAVRRHQPGARPADRGEGVQFRREQSLAGSTGRGTLHGPRLRGGVSARARGAQAGPPGDGHGQPCDRRAHRAKPAGSQGGERSAGRQRPQTGRWRARVSPALPHARAGFDAREIRRGVRRLFV
jgi:pyruvate,water dikinase